MAASETLPTLLDILKSPEFTGEEAMDQKAFQIRTVIKSGKHGQVSLCDSMEEVGGHLSKVAIKSELIKSPHNMHSRPYREYRILKQLAMLRERPEFYPNPQWVGFIHILDWFKVKTDHVRITESVTSPMKTPTRKAMIPSSRTGVKMPPVCAVGRQAPLTAPKSMSTVSRINFGDENDDVGNLMAALETGKKRTPRRVAATPTPKRVVPRTPLIMSTESKRREIRVQEGNLVLERADATLYELRNDLSFDILRDVLFQILYALYVAQTQYEFVHHDLHLQNVLLKGMKLEKIGNVKEQMGVFALGETRWYSRGPWIVKLSDFGLSRITIPDEDGVVVYDVAQPLAAAFVGDRDPLKILDEFSRVKVARWLNKQDCIELGVDVSRIKAHLFVQPDESITMDDLLSIMHSEEIVQRLKERIERKQRSIKSVRAALRRSALHLDYVLHHEFFAPLQQIPFSLWNPTSPSSPMSPTSPTKKTNPAKTNFKMPAGTPTSDRFFAPLTPMLPSLAAHCSDVSSMSTTPDSPPLPIKRLSFADTELAPATEELGCHKEQAGPIDPLLKIEPGLLTLTTVPKHSDASPPSVDLSNNTQSVDTTPIRRSARVAKRSDSPRNGQKPLVKPNPVVMASPQTIELTQNKSVELNPSKKMPISSPTLARTSTQKRTRRATVLPSELEASLSFVSQKMANLSIEPLESTLGDKKPVEEKKVEYGPIPARFIDPPIILPMLDKDPVNVIEAMKDYLVRRSAKLEETSGRRRKQLANFFIRNEMELAATRVERLHRKRRRKPARRSLGSVRSERYGANEKLPQKTLASTRARRKSFSSPGELAVKLAATTTNVTNTITVAAANATITAFATATATNAAAAALEIPREDEEKIDDKQQKKKMIKKQEQQQIQPAVIEPIEQSSGSVEALIEATFQVSLEPQDENDKNQITSNSITTRMRSRGVMKAEARAKIAAAVASTSGTQSPIYRAPQQIIPLPTAPAPKRSNRRASLTLDPLSPLFPTLTNKEDAFSGSSAKVRPPTPIKAPRWQRSATLKCTKQKFAAEADTLPVSLGSSRK